MEALLDQFDRKHTYLRISLTDKCNLRCTYCMPAEGIAWAPSEHLLQNAEIVRLAKIFAAMGVRKIRLTGGEPLLRKDLVPLVAELSTIAGIDQLTMTTNGVTLAARAAALKNAGLTGLTVSLDSLRSDRYAAIALRDRLKDTLQGIEAAIRAGFSPLKINCVVMRGINDDELLDYADWANERAAEIRFIEYMPFPNNHWHSAGVVPYREMMDILSTRYRLAPQASDPSAVGKTFTLGEKGALVSFVSSMTDSFCDTCNRLRLTADGQIKSCLFHPAETNLRDALRRGVDDKELMEIVRGAVWLKPKAHPPMEELLYVENRSMIAIGG